MAARRLVALSRTAKRIETSGMALAPSLRNLCEALRTKLGDNAFVHPEKDAIVDALSLILGIPAQNLIWTYLNKGPHEQADRDDFDGVHVETVVLTLEQLNALRLRRAA